MIARFLAWLIPSRASVPTADVPQIRTGMDPEWRPQGPRLDGPVASDWTGQGTVRDKVESVLPSAPADLTDDHLDWLGASPLARLMWMPPQQAMTRGYRVDTEGQRAVTADVDEQLRLREVLPKWLATARAGRGAHILIVAGDDDWSEPLPDGVGVGGRGVHALHVLDHRDATPTGDMETDPRSPDWGRPRTWRVTVRRQGYAMQPVTVHASRLVTHVGVQSLPAAVRSGYTPLGYGYSMWHLYWPSVRRLWSTAATGEVAGIELTTPWIKLGSVMQMMGDMAANARAALRSLVRMRSSHGLTVLSPGDEIGRDSLTLSGYSELTADSWSGVASVEGNPLTRLIGAPPAGLTSDDESGQQTWSMLLDGMSAEMERAGRRIHVVVFGPGARTWVWGPVRVPTDLEIAQAEVLRVQRDETLVRMGAASPAHIAARYQGPEVLADPVIPDDWTARPPQGIESVVAAIVGAHEAGLTSRETAVRALLAIGLANEADIAPPRA